MSSPNPDPETSMMSRTAGIALLSMLFVTGFALMGFEMLGARYLNPWFGGGITTWASLISVVLLAMMVGYMGGGAIADRSSGLIPMAAAIFIAGLNMLAVAIFADGWMETILDTIGDGFWGVLTGSLILCFLPVMCLAGLSPYVVKMLLREISHGGRITGLVYSVSTAGNIVGTLATTFWLIPAVGTRSITRIFAAILIVLAVVLIVQSRRRLAQGATSIVLSGFVFLAAANDISAETRSWPAGYPEGPLFVGETLYFAEMHPDHVSQIKDGIRSVFWKQRHCGPTAITHFGNRQFAINCHRAGTVVIVDENGKTQRTIEQAADGRALRNPNDINSQGGGPVFFSDPGPFHPAAEASGRVYRLDSQGTAHLVHEGLKYPNGVAFDADKKLLYVSEHLARRLWVFQLDEAFKVTGERVLMDGAIMFPEGMVPSDQVGPDGLRIDVDGSLYFAIYGAGFVFQLKPNGDNRRIRLPMPYVTSIALSADRVAITGAHVNNVPPYRGEVVVVDRVTFETADKVGF